MIRFAFAAALSILAIVGVMAPEVFGAVAVPGVSLGFVIVKLPGFSGVGTNQTAQAILPRGAAYRVLFTDLTDNAVDPTQANISTHYNRWQVKVNGVTKYDLTGTQLQAINAYKTNADENGVRSIWFTDPKAATMTTEDAMLYGTRGVDNMTLEIDIAGTATGPILALYAMVEPRPDLPLGMHRYVRRFQEAVGGATAEYNVTLMPPKGMNGRGIFAEKAHFFYSANAIQAARVIVSNTDVWSAKTKIYKSLNGGSYIPFVPQASYFHIDFTQTRRIGDSLSMAAEDMRVLLDSTGALTATHIWELIDARGVPANSLKALGMRY